MLEGNVFEKMIREALEERVSEVICKEVRNNVEYQQLETGRIEAFGLLQESLTTDKQRILLDDLESAWHLVEGLVHELVYRRGIIDAPLIHKALHNSGFSVTKEVF